MILEAIKPSYDSVILTILRFQRPAVPPDSQSFPPSEQNPPLPPRPPVAPRPLSPPPPVPALPPASHAAPAPAALSRRRRPSPALSWPRPLARARSDWRGAGAARRYWPNGGGPSGAARSA